MPRRELIVTTCEGLALVPEVMPALPASWWSVTAASSEVAGYPAASAAALRLGGQPRHVGEAGFAMALSTMQGSLSAAPLA